jgi:mannose-6-phosphate isomerase-like protein (cupin superfamily)
VSRNGYTLVREYARIPVPGDKVIEEIFGAVRTKTDDFSLAHMVAPPGWGESPQRPEFAEVTVMVRGTMKIEIGDALDHIVELREGQSIRIEPNVRVRYSNPFPLESEYFALCIPAFTPARARRE